MLLPNSADFVCHATNFESLEHHIGKLLTEKWSFFGHYVTTWSMHNGHLWSFMVLSGFKGSDSWDLSRMKLVFSGLTRNESVRRLL